MSKFNASAESATITRDRKLDIQYRRCEDLRPHRRNPRTHSKKQLQQIADSIREFGFTNPLLIDESSTVVAGH